MGTVTGQRVPEPASPSGLCGLAKSFDVSELHVSMGQREMVSVQPNTHGYCENPETTCVEELCKNAKPCMSGICGALFFFVCLQKYPTPETRFPERLHVK